MWVSKRVKSKKNIRLLYLSFFMTLLILFLTLLYRIDHVKFDVYPVFSEIKNIFMPVNNSYVQDLNPKKYAWNNFCNGTMFPEELIKNDTWSPVDKMNSMFVFSAYYNDKSKTVNVIGARLRTDSRAVCHLWYVTENASILNIEEIQAEIALPQEGPDNLKYTSTIFECQVKSTQIPAYVSIVKTSCQEYLNLLTVKDVTPAKSYPFQFTVCLSPLFDFRRAYDIVEWIELNRILGADRFIFYDYSTAENVQHVLNYYTKRCLAEVIKWKPEVKRNGSSSEQIDIHYHAQTACLNDCLYRSKRSSEFVVNVDFDEFIIPHAEDVKHWKEMIAQTGEPKTTYIFQSTYFVKEWENKDFMNVSEEVSVNGQNLWTLKVLKHDRHIFPISDRTKYMTRTNDSGCILIHYPCDNKRTVNVPTNLGLLHHYRSVPELAQITNNQIEDLTVKIKFEKELVGSVEKVWADFMQVQPKMTFNLQN